MKNVFRFILIILIIVSCKSALQVLPPEFAKYEFLNNVSSIQKDNTAEFQTDITFPLYSYKYDDSVLTNNFISFKGYSEQCIIYFHSKNIKSFLMYLNGKKIKTENICSSEYSAIKIYEAGHNGKNTLQILQLVPSDNAIENSEPYFLNIKIPFPKIVKTKNIKTSFSRRAFSILKNLFESQIENGYPAIQLTVIKNGELINSSAYGFISTVSDYGKPLKKKKRVTQKTIFDLASNTKMFSTNLALQKLVSEKKLSVNDKVISFFPDFKDDKKEKIAGKENITIEDLLNHQAGFPAGAGYYLKKEIRNKSKNDKRSNKKITLELICKTPLIYEPGTRFIYSDIDYILLGLIIEKVTKKSLDKYVEENIYKPLNLNSICYKPLEHGFKKKNIVATEIKAKKRSKEKKYKKLQKMPIHGVVHDLEAYTALEQVSGHAGLFANTEDVSVLAQVMLNGGGYGTKKIFDSHILNFFTSPSSESYATGLGWRRQGVNQSYSYFFSQLASPDSFGHTGWTGTLTLIDPTEDLAIIFFTSAKHTPTLYGNKLHGKFEGDFYLSKKYGAITTLIYAAFKNYSDDILDNMLIELAEQRYKMLDKEYYNNPGFLKDLKSIMDTIKKQSNHSEYLNDFLKTNRAKMIINRIEAI